MATGATFVGARGWVSRESVGTSDTASTAPAPTTFTWSTAPAGPKTGAIQHPLLTQEV